MTTRYLLVYLITLYLSSFACLAQMTVPQRVPAGMLPTYYNGGFAGEAGALRVATFSHFLYDQDEYPSNQQYQRHVSYSGSFVSIDHFLKGLRCGVALTGGYAAENQNMHPNHRSHANSFASIAISPKISSKGKYTFAPFADFYFGRGRDTVAFEFVTDGKKSTPGQYHWNDFRIKTGFLINSDKAYIGLSAQILDYSQSPYVDTNLKFFHGVKYIFQAGYTFQRTPESKFSFTPQLVYGLQRREHSYYEKPFLLERWNLATTYDLNFVFRYKKFIAGLNLTGIMLGYQNSKFKLQVSNFYSPSRQLYSGSIGLRYIFGKKETVKMPGF